MTEQAMALLSAGGWTSWASPGPKGPRNNCPSTGTGCWKNQVMNLTAITDPEEVVKRHFLDSAALLPSKALGGRKVIDVGTGAGVPRPGAEDPGPHHPAHPPGQPETGGLAGGTVPGTAPPRRPSSRAGRRSSPGRRSTGRGMMWPSPGPGLPCRCWRALPALCEARGPVPGHEEQQNRREIDAARAIIQTLGGGPLRHGTICSRDEIYHRVVTVFKSRPTPKAYPRKWSKIKGSKNLVSLHKNYCKTRGRMVQ